MYSQFEEDEIIASFFGDKVGCFYDIGANDGKTFSNSFRLVCNGWSGVCVEPTTEAFQRLQKLHQDNPKVQVVNCAITEKDGETWLIVNGSHYSTDVGLLSVVCGEDFDSSQPIPKDAYNWQKYEKVKTLNFESLTKQIGSSTIDFISIDAEGYDLKILSQIQLNKYGAQMVIVETDNSKSINDSFDFIFEAQEFKLHTTTLINRIYIKK
jgi:FkbM family methyltransferase